MFVISASTEAEVILKQWESEGTLFEHLSQAVIEYARKDDEYQEVHLKAVEVREQVQAQPRGFSEEDIEKIVTAKVNELLSEAMSRIDEHDDSFSNLDGKFDTIDIKLRGLRDKLTNLHDAVETLKIRSYEKVVGFNASDKGNLLEDVKDTEVISESAQTNTPVQRQIGKTAARMLDGLL